MKTAGAILCWLWVCAAGSAAPVPSPAVAEALTNAGQTVQLHIALDGTNSVWVGTNRSAMVRETGQAIVGRTNLDAMAVYTELEGDRGLANRTALLDGLMRVGRPILVVEEDGRASLPQASDTENVRTIGLSTEYLGRIKRFVGNEGRQGSGAAPKAVARSSVDWNSDADTYELRKVEVGVLGRRVWLVHDIGSDGEAASTGLLLRMSW